ncbi:MAG: MerR family transcriptional regulator [Pseudomonadota bacterium]|nr:MerR family transcriptional regulator [Pseudomonadota bacterium]
MRISELAAATGLSLHRIRRYVDCGLLIAPRTSGGYRSFDVQAVRDARFIVMGRDIGFSLAELADLLPRYRARTLTIDEMVERLQARIAAVDALLAEQQALRGRLQEHVAWFEERRERAAKKAAAPPSVFERHRRRHPP